MSRPQSAFRGAIFTVGMRWADRLLGVASMLILARLLTPGDFGLVAMASMAVALVDIFLDLGVSAALVQNRDATREDFDTAWSLRLLQAMLGASLVAVGAPLAAEFFGDPRVVEIMRVIAITVVIGGIENIGIVHFQKDMQFDREFRFFLAKRATGVILTIVLALWLRSYWALVLGSLATRVAGVAFSYVMHPFRPRLSLARIRGIWSFSQWNLVNSLAAYFVTKSDKLYVGKRMDAAAMGAYSLAEEIATMPSTELLQPLSRVMFPAFVNARGDPAELLRIVLLSLSVQALIAIPAGIGVALVAKELVPVLLGVKWLSAIPVMQVLGVACAFSALSSSSHYALLALGHVRTLAGYYVALAASMVMVFLGVVSFDNPEQVAIVRSILIIAGLIALNRIAGLHIQGFTFARVLGHIWRPILASLVMAAVLAAVSSVLSGVAVTVVLLCKVIAGVMVYSLAVLLLWKLSGLPDAGEMYLLRSVGKASFFERIRLLNARSGRKGQ